MIHEKVVIWSSYSFEKRYAEYHIMVSRIKTLLDRGTEVLLIQKSFNEINCVPQELAGYTKMKTIAIPFRESRKQSFIARYLRELAYYLKSFRYIPPNVKIFIQSSFAAWMPVMLIHWLKRHNRVIYNVQDVFPENAAAAGTISKQSLTYSALFYLQSQSYRWADKIITISSDMKETISIHNIPENKIEVIHNWSGYDKAKQMERQNVYAKRARLPEHEFRVVYAGNVGVMQNVISILRAAERMQDETIHFYIIGDGTEKKHIEEYQKNRQLKNVTLLPATSEDEAWAAYNMADVNIIPLVRGGIHTAFPSKIAACFQAGRNIIMCIDLDSKTAQYFKKNPQCEVVEPNDLNALTQAIKRVYKEQSIQKCDYKTGDVEKLFSQKVNCEAYADCILNIKK